MRDAVIGGLNHAVGRVDEGEHTFRSRETILNIGPERGQVHHREEKTIQAQQEQVPRAHTYQPLHGRHSADVDHEGSRQSLQRIQRREDNGEHQAALDVHPI